MWKQGIFLIAIIMIANVHAKSNLDMHKPSNSVLQAIQVFLKKQDLSNDQISEVTKLLSSLKQEYVEYQTKSTASLEAKYKECEADVNTLECRYESEWSFNVKELTRGVEDINLNKLPSLNSTLQSYEADVKRQQSLIETENSQLKEKTDDLNLEVDVVQKAIDLISSYYKLSSFVQLYSKLNNALNNDDRRSFIEVAKSLDETYNQVQERSIVSHFLKGSLKNSRIMAKVNSLTSLLQKQSENGYDKASQVESAQHVVNLLKKLVETIKAAVASEEKESKETNEVYQKTIDTVNSKIEEVKKNIAEYEGSVAKNKEEIERLNVKIQACQGKPKSIEGDCAQYSSKSTEINIEVNEILKQIDEILAELENLKL